VSMERVLLSACCCLAATRLLDRTETTGED
jgi:hypothetical protein